MYFIKIIKNDKKKYNCFKWKLAPHEFWLISNKWRLHNSKIAVFFRIIQNWTQRFSFSVGPVKLDLNITDWIQFNFEVYINQLAPFYGTKMVSELGINFKIYYSNITWKKNHHNCNPNGDLSKNLPCNRAKKFYLSILKFSY